jgi:hypothetical protein
MTDCCRTDHISDDDRYPPIACRAVVGRTAPAACLPEWTDTFGADCEDPFVCVIEAPSDD